MQPDLSEILPVLLCGGLGARLYPISTPEKPKPYLNLTSESESLLQITARRMSGALEPVVICHKDHVAMTREQFIDIDIVPKQIIAEPMRRNTGPAIALAVSALQYTPDQIILCLPCDHEIQDLDCFISALCHGVKAARDGHIALFAEKPSYAETGYGYISLSQETSLLNVYDVHSFHEKPNMAAAKEYIEHGFLWNTGMVMAKVSALMDVFIHYTPEIWAILGQCERQKADEVWSVSGKYFEEIPSVSFDVAILEKCQSLKCVPVEMGWKDIGNLSAL